MSEPDVSAEVFEQVVLGFGFDAAPCGFRGPSTQGMAGEIRRDRRSTR